MPLQDANDPASHCLGLLQPFHSSFAYGQSSRTPLTVSSSGGATNNAISLSFNPPKEEVDYEEALRYLFTDAKQDAAARELCREIGLEMQPPIELGVLLYLFRLQAIGRIEEWPLLFGKDNSFILYLLGKMAKNEFPKDSENEKMIWDLRRRDTAEWLSNK